jgi:hypothetical protein
MQPISYARHQFPAEIIRQALSREWFLLVKGGNAGLCASRNFNGLATGWTAAD